MTRSQTHCVLWISTIVGLSLASCGGNSQDASPASPLGQNTPGVSPEDSTHLRWTALFHETLSDSPASHNECVYPRQFTIDPIGNFTAGPCETGGEEKHGSINPEEFSQVSSIASRILAQDPRVTEVCDHSTSPTKSNVWMTLSDGYMYSTYQNAPNGQSCYSGGKTNADDLTRFMIQLESKYYPTHGAHH